MSARVAKNNRERVGIMILVLIRVLTIVLLRQA
jgi:hypothetical protein